MTIKMVVEDLICAAVWQAKCTHSGTVGPELEPWFPCNIQDYDGLRNMHVCVDFIYT